MVSNRDDHWKSSDRLLFKSIQVCFECFKIRLLNAERNFRKLKYYISDSYMHEYLPPQIKHRPHSMQLKPCLTLKVARHIVLNLIMAWRAEEQRPIHQRKLLKYRQRPVAQCTVDHVSLARTESWQDEPIGWRHSKKNHHQIACTESSGRDRHALLCKISAEMIVTLNLVT